ncbi:MAG: MarR family transcriptional regulator, partial [Flavobacteriales bacterium]|nr:MarR family transcriptional regulator [Flavobacteriales bacterium]
MKLEDEIKQGKPFSNERQKAMVNIMFTNGWANDRFREFMRPYGLTQQQYNVLRILRGSEPDPLSTSCIRDRMIDRMSDASRIVDRLLKKDLVVRTQCPRDRRLVEIRISEPGLQLLHQIDVEQELMHESFGSLNDAELVQLNQLLDKL